MNRQPVFWQLLKKKNNESDGKWLSYPSGVTPPLHGLINELIDVTDIHMDNYPGMMRSDVRTHLLHISVIGSGTR